MFKSTVMRHPSSVTRGKGWLVADELVETGKETWALSFLILNNMAFN
jgi:hypothetical protein